MEAQLEAQRAQAVQENFKVVTVDPEAQAAVGAEGGVEDTQLAVEEFDLFAERQTPLTDPEKILAAAEEI